MPQFKVSRTASLPLHIQLLGSLRHMVLTHSLQPHERLPSEWELAKQLGISRATIQKAWLTAEQEGLLYRVAGKGTFVAEPRPEGTSRLLVGLVVPDFHDTFGTSLLHGTERVLRQNGYRLEIAASEYSVQEENRVLKRMLDEQVNGLIIWSVKAEHEQHHVIDEMAKTMPVVLIDRPIPDLHLPCVSSNHYAGGQQAMQHLLELGHRRIAFLSRPQADLWAVTERYRAYQDALLAHGLEPLPPILIGDERELSSFNAYNSDDEITLAPLLTCLRANDRPTAIFAVNDWMAIRVFRAATIVNLHVPQDLSVVGFDNLDVAQHLTPPLTTIEQSKDMLGAEAARRLLMIVKDGEPASDVVTLLPTRLIIRHSTRAIKG